ncbi:MAG: bifunctional DNA-binding transcriptional regulator/O6-methylguanine-DNA methyltransferase Ada [Candidatus Sulfobium sp.]
MDPAVGKDWWKAVQSRDRRFDESFVYAVRSTGIYCRPSCAAKRPKPDQVIFFKVPAEAKAAGFRPCLRCRPDEAPIPDEKAETARRLCRFIEKYDSTDRPLTLKVMGEHMSIGPCHLQRIFKQVMGISPGQYADACRLNRLKALVRKGKTVTHALYESGYSSSSRLYEDAASRLGMTPGTYLRRGEGVEIGFTLVDCPLGRMLVAATDKGLCAVSIGDSDEALITALHDEYPAAGIHRDRAGLSEYITALLGYFGGKQPSPGLPLHLQVTAFQWKVYEVLRAIPFGQTRTYEEIARAIGSPGAARAVGRACARNPVAVVIPCHRVVRKDGTPGDYRWGIKNKKALLGRERGRAS